MRFTVPGVLAGGVPPARPTLAPAVAAVYAQWQRPSSGLIHGSQQQRQLP